VRVFRFEFRGRLAGVFADDTEHSARPPQATRRASAHERAPYLTPHPLVTHAERRRVELRPLTTKDIAALGGVCSNALLGRTPGQPSCFMS
jgi:hypothetical protein